MQTAKSVAYGHDDPLPNIECLGCRTVFHEDALKEIFTNEWESSALAPDENQRVEYDPRERLTSTVAGPKCGRENSSHTRVCPRCETRLKLMDAWQYLATC